MCLWPKSLPFPAQPCWAFSSCAVLCPTRFRAQCQANVEIERDRRNDQREPGAMHGVKMFPQRRQDFVGSIDMFPLNEPVVALMVAIFEQPLGRDFSRQSISQAALARDDDRENPLRLADAANLAESRRQIGQMFQHMNR